MALEKQSRDFWRKNKSCPFCPFDLCYNTIVESYMLEIHMSGPHTLPGCGAFAMPGAVAEAMGANLG